MRIDKVTVRDCVAFREPFTTSFKNENCVVGLNGCGKTTLLRLIAGVAGSDDATELVDGLPVGFFRIRLSQGKKAFVFEAEGEFDTKKIAEFKATLPCRVSFPLTDFDWVKNYPSDLVDPKLGREKFKRFIKAHNGAKPTVFYVPSSRRVSLEMGDGYTHALWMLLSEPPHGVPLLLDNPSRHLDIRAKRMMVDFLTGGGHQVIFTTHDPEMVLHNGYTGKNPNQRVIEVPTRRNTTKKKKNA